MESTRGAASGVPCSDRVFHASTRTTFADCLDWQRVASTMQQIVAVVAVQGGREAPSSALFFGIWLDRSPLQSPFHLELLELVF